MFMRNKYGETKPKQQQQQVEKEKSTIQLQWGLHCTHSYTHTLGAAVFVCVYSTITTSEKEHEMQFNVLCVEMSKNETCRSHYSAVMQFKMCIYVFVVVLVVRSIFLYFHPQFLLRRISALSKFMHTLYCTYMHMNAFTWLAH